MSYSISKSAGQANQGASARAAQNDVGAFLCGIKSRDTSATIDGIDQQFGAAAYALDNASSKSAINGDVLRNLADTLSKIVKLLDTLARLTGAQRPQMNSSSSATNSAGADATSLLNDIISQLFNIDRKCGAGSGAGNVTGQNSAEVNSHSGSTASAGAQAHSGHNHAAHNTTGHSQGSNHLAHNTTGHTQGVNQHNKHGAAEAGHNHAGHNHAGDNNTGHSQGGHNHSGNSAPGAGHNFVEHTKHLYPGLLAPNQRTYGGYADLGDTIIARSTITAQEPVIRQAIEQVTRGRSPEQLGLTQEQLEQRVANQITNLNDWSQLTRETKNEIMIRTGVDFDSMPKAEREKTINHLLHSPLPFGEITTPLRPGKTIDLGFTHTLDKNKTMAENLGNGLFKITLISNNNNGSHTGHSLGSFAVQLDANATTDIAKKVGNDMVRNTNNNNKLYLDQAAKDILAREMAGRK